MAKMSGVELTARTRMHTTPIASEVLYLVRCMSLLTLCGAMVSDWETERAHEHDLLLCIRTSAQMAIFMPAVEAIERIRWVGHHREPLLVHSASQLRVQA